MNPKTWMNQEVSMGPSGTALVAELAFFVIALIMFGVTFFFRKPGSKIFASVTTVRETYTSGGAICYWIGMACLFVGIILQLTNRLS